MEMEEQREKEKAKGAEERKQKAQEFIEQIKMEKEELSC
jgi:hypothetical protein